MSAAPATMRRVPPKLGEHTDEVLSETVTARRT
jgi:crotonobetainyl-CoA:carnitine CoA-transferase CaiB-like acyl-CoA transferase